MKTCSQSGFSLLTSLAVVAGLCLLAGVVLLTFPAELNGCYSSRDARRAADLKNIQAALESYKREHGNYPSTCDEWFGDMKANGSFSYDAAGYVPGLVPGYLPALPKDPDNQYPTAEAGYMYRSNGTDYKFVAHGTPETHPSGNPFRDPQRPDSAWQISSQGGVNW